MGEFNVNKSDGSLVPTAGYGGMIKISGTTLADLIAALNGMTEDQKTRCEISLYLNTENFTNFFVLKRYNENINIFGTEVHDMYSASYDEVTIYDGTTRVTHFAIALHVTKLTSETTATIRRVSGSNGYDLTSSLSSWSILYQDDSVTGGNTYPASQVMMSDGETSVEDAVNSLRFYTVNVPATPVKTLWAGSIYYNTIELNAPENLTGKKVIMSFERTTEAIVIGWTSRIISNGTRIEFSMCRPDNSATVSGKLHLMVKD